MAIVSCADTGVTPPPGQELPQLLLVGHSTNKVAGALKITDPNVGRSRDCGLALARTMVFWQTLGPMQMLALPRQATAGCGRLKVRVRAKVRQTRSGLLVFIIRFFPTRESRTRMPSVIVSGRRFI